MKKTINREEFIEMFDDYNRSENFSYAGRSALFDYLELLELDLDEEFGLDVIALCCEFSEYASLKEFQADYGEEYETLEDIENETIVIRIDDEAFIIQSF